MGSRRSSLAGVAGCLGFVLIGWSALVLPALIRSIQDGFGQDDAGIGVLYLLYAVAYATGSFASGLAVERIGRRAVLVVGPVLLSIGLAALAAAAAWPAFLVASIPMGLGIGTLDAGINGLFLDAFRERRGRALNLLHVFFSLGALGSPLVVGRLVEAGVDWRAVLTATAVAGLPLAVLFAAAVMPAGRRQRADPASGRGATAARGPTARRLALPMVLLAIAIACYVAGQGGISSWLVRFLEPAPAATATTALALFWAGLTVGRVASARIADRFDHARFTAAGLAVLTAAMLAAILVPVLPVRIALLALAGAAAGPVYPMIMAIAGDRYPDRSGAVAGVLASAAVAGTVVYPPLMGFVSVAAGLQLAMLGAVVLLGSSLAAIVAVGRTAAPEGRPAGAAAANAARGGAQG